MFTRTIFSWFLTCLLLQAYFVESAEKTKLVIVGAGVSGLGAATRLLERGFQDFKILEAEGRIGGRVHSTQLGDGATVDYGAHWVHGGAGNAVFDLADPLGLIEESADGREIVTLFSDGGQFHTSIDPFDSAKVTPDVRNLNNVSSKELLYKKTRPDLEKTLAKEYVEPFLEVLEKMQCTLEGCDDLGDVSARLVNDYLQLNSSQTLGWKGKGYGSLIDLLLRRHPKSTGPPLDLGDRLRLNSEVTKITVKADGSGVEVLTKSGELHLADVALVTVSAGVLKERMDSLFQPPLPEEKKQAIKALGCGTIDKIILRFPYAWWPNDTSGFQLVWTDKDKASYKGEYSWETEMFVVALERWSPHTMTAWMNGDAARAMEKTPLDGVQRAATRVIRRFLGSNYTIPDPVEVIRSTWGTNPHFRCSYGYRRLEAERHNVSHIATPILDSKTGNQVILFAGEATHPYFFSTVHGALTSGWREAERILASTKTTS